VLRETASQISPRVFRFIAQTLGLRGGARVDRHCQVNAKDVIGVPIYGGIPQEGDDREITLAIDVEALEVRHVRQVEYRTEDREVSRERIKR